MFKGKVFLVDTECTGVDFKANGVWQIAGYIIIDGDIKEKFNFECRPFENDIFDDKAVEMSGKSIEQLKALDNPKDTYKRLNFMLERYVNKFDKKDKYQFVGYNANFDMQMLREWFSKCGDNYFGSWFWFPCLDVMSLAAWDLRDNRNKLENFKLGTVSDHYGIKLSEDEKLHDAEVDIRLTLELAKILLN